MATSPSQRSQNDPKAPQNQGPASSQLSSEAAQHQGSTEGNRSVQSGVSGIPSQPHVADDPSTRTARPEERTGTRPTDKHGNSRIAPDAD